MKKERLERIIAFAREIQQKGEPNMNFDAFDSEQIEEYAARAKAQWGKTEAYAEYEKKAAHRSAAAQQQIAAGLMDIFTEFGSIRESAAADSPEAAALVQKLQAYITEHYYHCTDEILAGLGAMYAADGEFRQNIDRAGGEGTADFASRAIAAYCKH
jgi:dGTP triphosphohydrolase